MALTLNQVQKALETIATNHRQINSYGSGELYDIVTSGDTNYPLMYTMLENSTIGGKIESLVFTILVMDIVKGGRVNEDEVASDMLEIVKDIIAQLQHPSYDWEFDLQSVTIEPFTERFGDSVTGYSFKVTLLLPFAYDRCVMPYTPTSIPDVGCPVVTIYDSNGNVLTTVSAGGTYTVTGGGGSNATVRNSDSSYSTTVACGGALVLPDELITVNVNGIFNQSATYIPLSTTTINITA